jgi:hypothetical protein
MRANAVPKIRTSQGHILYGQYVRGMPVVALEEILDLARQQPSDLLSLVTTRAAAHRHDDQDRQGGEREHKPDDRGDTQRAPAAQAPHGEQTFHRQPTANMPTDAMHQASTMWEVLPQHHLNDRDQMLLLHRIFHEDLAKLAKIYRQNLAKGIFVPRSMLGQQRASYHSHDHEEDTRRAGEMMVMDICQLSWRRWSPLHGKLHRRRGAHDYLLPREGQVRGSWMCQAITEGLSSKVRPTQTDTPAL